MPNEAEDDVRADRHYCFEFVERCVVEAEFGPAGGESAVDLGDRTDEATGSSNRNRPLACATAIAVAVIPFVVEKTGTNVSASHLSPRPRSRTPPHRSTTFCP